VSFSGIASANWRSALDRDNHIAMLACRLDQLLRGERKPGKPVPQSGCDASGRVEQLRDAARLGEECTELLLELIVIHAIAALRSLLDLFGDEAQLGELRVRDPT
jgi:hypothetical protein